MNVRHVAIGLVAAFAATAGFAQEVTIAGSTTVQKRILDPAPTASRPPPASTSRSRAAAPARA